VTRCAQNKRCDKMCTKQEMKSLEYGKVNTIKVTSNILLPYEGKLDGCKHLKEKEVSHNDL
jgi:hypothetical protein